MNHLLRPLIAVLALLLGACAAPQTMTESGKVTPRGDLKVATHNFYSANTRTASALFSGFKDTANALIDEAQSEESIQFDSSVRSLNEGLIAYALEPLGAGYEVALRYGVYTNLEAGYAYQSGRHLGELRYQLVGSNLPEEPSSFAASLGLRYSQQSYRFPTTLALDKLQDLFGFEATRKDLILPITVSHHFGGQKEFASLAYGLGLSWTQVSYGFDPSSPFEIVNDGTLDTTKLQAFNETKTVLGYGAFVNGRLGYEGIFLVASLSLLYQDYGEFRLLDGDNEQFSGLSLIPTLGIETAF